jgi:DNA-directed RNA polymerase specialized sigma24 family protein
MTHAVLDSVATRWSLLGGLHHGGEAERAAAWGWFAQVYWPAVYGYVRRSGLSPEDAGDATQDFFAHALSSQLIDKADKARGRLRTLVMVSMKRFLITQYRASTTQRRGGAGPGPISLDLAEVEGWYGREPSDGLTPEVMFDRRWLASLLREAVHAVKADFDERGSGDAFAQALPLALDAGERGSAELESTKSPALRSQAHRIRKQLRVKMLDLVKQSLEVPTDAAAMAELTFLLGR